MTHPTSPVAPRLRHLSRRRRPGIAEPDPIAPARGCLNGALLGLLLWVAAFGGAALVCRGCCDERPAHSRRHR